jgi:hypothetical protein
MGGEEVDYRKEISDLSCFTLENQNAWKMQ